MLTKLLADRQKYDRKTVRIAKRTMSAIIADTPVKRMVGLMYRKGLKKNECMLFIFENESTYPIWMRNMRFPIDAIWLDSNKKVVGTKQNLQPAKTLDLLTTYDPGKPSKFLLEVEAGFVKKNGIKSGSPAEWAELTQGTENKKKKNKGKEKKERAR